MVAPTSPDLSPVNVHLVRPHVQEGRWVWMGDSFAVPSRGRVSFSSLATWPLQRVGAVAVGSGALLARLVPDGPYGREVRYEEGYVLAPGSPLEATMGLPVYRVVEWELPVGASALGSVDVLRSQLDDGEAAAAGGLFAGGLTMRPLLYVQQGAQARGEVRLGDGALPPTALPTEPGFALGLPSAVPDLPRAEVPLTVTLSEPGYVHHAGSVLTGATEGGHYAQFIADASWSYWGYAQDKDPVLPDSVKRFRTGDLASYLRATTLDPQQPTVVAVYLAQERRLREVLEGDLRGVVSRTRAAFETAGLPAPVVLFVHPHAIESNVVNDGDTNTRAGEVMRAIALADPGVAFVSLYDATNGVVFDGRPEAQAWLTDAGLDRLAFGAHVDGQEGPVRLLEEHGANLLDAEKLHPTQAGAAFFSYMLGRVLTGTPVDREAAPAREAAPLLSPNPARPGARVAGATPGAMVADLLGRRIGEVGLDGSLRAPSVPGVYLVGRSRLVVQ